MTQTLTPQTAAPQDDELAEIPTTDDKDGTDAPAAWFARVPAPGITTSRHRAARRWARPRWFGRRS